MNRLNHGHSTVLLIVRSFTSSTYFRVTAALFLVLLTTLMLVDRPTKIEKRIVERREVQGKDAPTHWLVPVWLWRGLALNTALAAAIVALTPLARRPAFPIPSFSPNPSPSRIGKKSSSPPPSFSSPPAPRPAWANPSGAMKNTA